MFEFLKFEIQILQMASDEKTFNTKVVDLEKLWNFVVDNFLIWIGLGPQTLNLLPIGYNMWGSETEYRHMWCCGAVVVEGIGKVVVQVSGSKPGGHGLCAKNAATCDGDGRARSSQIKIFFSYF